VLDKEGVKAILPHREPFLLVDRVEEFVPGQSRSFLDVRDDMFWCLATSRVCGDAWRAHRRSSQVGPWRAVTSRQQAPRVPRGIDRSASASVASRRHIARSAVLPSRPIGWEKSQRGRRTGAQEG
jgi:hypothetical protein